MAEKKKGNKPNILSVSLRLVLIVLFLGGAYAVYKLAGAEKPGMISLIGIGALLLGAAIVLIQLIVWGLKWVKNERVSELGLHIVRYAVTLASIALCVFVLLSADYMELYSTTHMNELRQNAISGSRYIQSAIGEEIIDDSQYFAQVEQAADSLLLDTEENKIRHACIYLKSDAVSAEGASFVRMDGGYLALSTNDEIPCAASVETLNSVLDRFSVEYREDSVVGTYNLVSAYSPIFSVTGEPVGVLEICEIKQVGAGIFRFATLELCLKLLALIAFFSFMFYGCMQLVDILLRPRQFDRSRRVLSCGRESARPILFLITLSAALPVMMLLFADNIRALMDPYQLPFGIGTYVPFIAYLLGITIGQLFGRGHRNTLSEIPADAGLLFSFLCNLALCLFMDWKVLSGIGLADNVIFVLVLVFICGLGYGIAYRITAKFQAQSDALFGYDKYVYLCSCLGAISGIVLGALIIENYSNVTLRVVSCILTAFTAVIAIILLEDLKTTVEIDESSKDALTSYAGGIAGIIPVGLACCYVWIYLAEYMRDNGISTAAIGFCTIMPIVAFCFGNRLRLKHRAAQRGALAISATLSAIAFVPMALWPSFGMAVVSCLIVCIAVIFAASGVYSTTRHGELKKLTFRAMPLMFIGIILAIIARNLGDGMIDLLSAGGACLLFMLFFLISKYPSRPIIESKLPAITAGAKEVKKPVAVITTGKPEEASKTEQTEEAKPQEDKKKKRKEKKVPAPVVLPEKDDDKADSEQKQEDKPKENKPEEKAEEKQEPAAEVIPAAEPEPKPDEKKEEPAKEDPAKEESEEEDEPLPIIFFDEPEEEAAPEPAPNPEPVPEPEAEPETKPEVESQASEKQAAAPESTIPESEPNASENTEAKAENAADENPDKDIDHDDEVAAALARAAAAQRAKERWKQYNQTNANGGAEQ